MNYVTLINRLNPIKDKFKKNIVLKEIVNIYNENIYIEEKTLEAYLKLKEYLESKNIIVGIDSSFRTSLEQRHIMESYIEIFGEDYASKYVAPVNTSEHETGLAIDVTIKVDGNYLLTNDELLKEEKIYKKIHKELAKFGFILRYPKEKRNITGYNYEPWHFRYVGVVPATIIMENNLTLEEYLKDYSGVLVVNKPKGITSYDVIREVTKVLGIKKIGHTGTLDPIASGVLVLTINKATKIGDLLSSTKKEYIATVKMGIETDSLDTDGKIILTKEVKDKLNIKETLKSFKKTYLQEVPKYSAVKVNGKKLYDYARNNEEVVLPKKEITIYNIELLSEEKELFMFKAEVSKGTYIRSLIRDIGQKLDTPCTMSDLVRTKQGDFSIDNSYTIEDIKMNNFKILNITRALNYKLIKLEDALLKKVSNGAVIDNSFNIKDKVMFIDKENNLIAIYENSNNKLRSWKNF